MYGDCGGAWVDESRPLAPQSDRARRARVDAERALRDWGAASAACDDRVLRVPGIYAAERLPLAQLRRGTPVLRAEDDVYTNHIHADDLAAICVRRSSADAPAGIYNASDDSEMKMGDYFDLVADRAGLPRPPRITRAAAERRDPAGAAVVHARVAAPGQPAPEGRARDCACATRPCSRACRAARRARVR